MFRSSIAIPETANGHGAIRFSRFSHGGLGVPGFVVGSPWRALGRVLWAWADRAGQRRALAALDARLLADAGLTPADAAREAAKPFWRA